MYGFYVPDVAQILRDSASGNTPTSTGSTDLSDDDLARELGLDPAAADSAGKLAQARQYLGAGASLDTTRYFIGAAAPADTSGQAVGADGSPVSNYTNNQLRELTRGLQPGAGYITEAQYQQQLDRHNNFQDEAMRRLGIVGALALLGGGLGGGFGGGGAGSAGADLGALISEGMGPQAVVGGAGAGAGAGAAATTYPLVSSGGPIVETAVSGVGPAASGAGAAGPAAGAIGQGGQDMTSVISGGGTVGGGGTAGGAGGGGTRGIGRFLRNNQDIIGSVVAGIGEGIAADRAADADRDLLNQRHELVSSNYRGTDPGRTFRGLNPGNSQVSPVARFDRYSGWEYDYDPQTGKIVKKPRDPVQLAR